MSELIPNQIKNNGVNELGLIFGVGAGQLIFSRYISYIPTAEGFLYLAFFIAFYTRKVVGFFDEGSYAYLSCDGSF